MFMALGGGGGYNVHGTGGVVRVWKCTMFMVQGGVVSVWKCTIFMVQGGVLDSVWKYTMFMVQGV